MSKTKAQLLEINAELRESLEVLKQDNIMLENRLEEMIQENAELREESTVELPTQHIPEEEVRKRLIQITAWLHGLLNTFEMTSEERGRMEVGISIVEGDDLFEYAMRIHSITTSVE